MDTNQRINILESRITTLDKQIATGKSYIDEVNDFVVIMPAQYEAWLNYQREVNKIHDVPFPRKV